MASATKKTRLCQLPSPGNIAGRSSSITNAFFNAIIPIHEPTDEEALEALRLLKMDPNDVRCAYCGDKSTEWDHLRPLIVGQKPTGYITEIANLVPACGKCNQSKGNSDWRNWMLSTARLSPTTRGKTDIAERIENLTIFSTWKPATKINFELVLDTEIWDQHVANWRKVLGLLQESQLLAKEIRDRIEAAPRHRNRVTGEVIYGVGEPEIELDVDDEKLLEPEEMLERINKILTSHGGQPIGAS